MFRRPVLLRLFAFLPVRHLVAVAAGAAVFTGTASAEIVGNSTQPYDARVRVVVEGQSYTGRIRHRHGMQRHEFDGDRRRLIRILRFDLGLVWTLDPMRRRYSEDALSEVGADVGILDDNRVQLTQRGGERVLGDPSTRYAFAGVLREGGPIAGNLWLARDGILLRVEGVSRLAGRRYRFHYAVSELHRRPQSAAQFVVPSGYQREIRRPAWGVEASIYGWSDVVPQNADGPDRPEREAAGERDPGSSSGVTLHDDVLPPPSDDPGSLESLFRMRDQ